MTKLRIYLESQIVPAVDPLTPLGSFPRYYTHKYHQKSSAKKAIAALVAGIPQPVVRGSPIGETSHFPEDIFLFVGTRKLVPGKCISSGDPRGFRERESR
jgi:hypothetical protein